MKIRSNTRAALTLPGAVIILTLILIIGAMFVSIIVKMARRIQPPSSGGGSGSTNSVSYPPGWETNGYPGVSVTCLSFAIPAAPGQSDDQALEAIQVMVIERTTNLVDWQPIFETTNLNVVPMDVDTNKPWPCAFYRGRLVMP